MKKLICAAGFLALAACGQPATEEAEPATEETVVAVEGAGTFDYSSEDGSMSGRIVMNEDGTFEDTEADGTVLNGTWRAADGQTCFMGPEEGAEEVCWTDSEAAEDGSFTSTSPDGMVVTVTPVTEDGETEA